MDILKLLKTKKTPLLMLIFVFILIYYGLFTLQAVETGFQTPENLYYLSKVMLEVETPYFYFIDYNSNQPPLPYFAALLFRNPYMAAIATGSFLALFVFWLFRSKKYVEILIFIAFSFFFLYVPLLYLFTCKLQLAIYSFLFIVSNFFLIRFLKKRAIYDIFYFGMIFGLSYFSFYEAFYLIPFYLLIIFICTRDTKLDHKLSLFLVAFLPLVFMVLSWSYLSWIFTGRAVLLLSSAPMYLRFMVYTPTTTLLENAYQILKDSLRYAFIYFALFPLLFLEKRFWRSPLIYIYLSPLFLLLIKTISSGFAPEFHEYTLLFLIIPVVYFFFRDKSFRANTVLALLLALFLVIGNIAFFNYGSEHENQFARSLARQQLEVKPFYYQEIATLLNASEGKILMDNDILHPVIVYTEDVTRYILPYNLDFKIGLNNPGLIAEHVVLAEAPYIDRVASIWPAEKGIPGFDLVYEKDGVYFFTKK